MLELIGGRYGSGANMGAGNNYPAAGGGRGQMRAGDADRERVAALLNTAYVDGRLSKDEHDARLDATMSARTYGELDQVVTDLPAVPATGVSPVPAVSSVPATNSLAIASLAFGLGQFVFWPLAIPAIVCGHKARSQIRRTGEQGAGLATAGLALGWGLVSLVILAVVALIVFVAAFGSMHMR
jgi:DUF1707 SHOCT-like domain/Domain of unknown function (DUF4190)